MCTQVKKVHDSLSASAPHKCKCSASALLWSASFNALQKRPGPQSVLDYALQKGNYKLWFYFHSLPANLYTNTSALSLVPFQIVPRKMATINRGFNHQMANLDTKRQ